jgi:hypothetical protein
MGSTKTDPWLALDVRSAWQPLVPNDDFVPAKIPRRLGWCFWHHRMGLTLLATTKKGSEMNSPQVPISWGELFDKITILQIKLENLTSKKALKNVEQELKMVLHLVIDMTVFIMLIDTKELKGRVAFIFVDSIYQLRNQLKN